MTNWWAILRRFFKVAAASHAGRVLRRDGAVGGAIQEDRHPDTHNYRPLDGDQQERLLFIRNTCSTGTPGEAKHYLIIGPWIMQARVHQRRKWRADLPKSSLLDLNKLHSEWYGWTMKGSPKARSS